MTCHPLACAGSSLVHEAGVGLGTAEMLHIVQSTTCSCKPFAFRPRHLRLKCLCLQEEYLRGEGYSEDQVKEFVSQVCLACRKKL